MRTAFAFIAFGVVSMVGIVLGASMPWAGTMHGWVFGWLAGHAVEGSGAASGLALLVSDHLVFALVGAMGAMIVAWVGFMWLIARRALLDDGEPRNRRDLPERARAR